MRQEILSYLQGRVNGSLLPWVEQVEAADHFCVSCAEVEMVALENGILPARYQRNIGMFSVQDQLELFRSKVAVLGCGGLGGHFVEALARLGVGHIVAIDPDVFEEHNLNRQLLSSPLALGRPKVAVAAERVAQINPAVRLTPIQEAFGAENGKRLLGRVRVAVDGLDSIPVRLELAEVCRAVGIPLVHGAIAGWYGHVGTQMPGDEPPKTMYGRNGAARGVEKDLGNPSFTPAVIACMQVAEVCKVLLHKGSALRGRSVAIDLLDMEFTEVAG